MDAVLDLVTGGHGVAQAILVLGLVGVVGLALGNVAVAGARLGIGGVLFAGILFGHLGVEVEPAFLDFVRDFGLVLFVYCIGLQVGPGFFGALRKDGLALNLMALAVVVLGTLTAAAIHLLADVPLPAILGLLAGAVTNTPSLAAGQQVLREVGASADQLVQPGLGYAIAYPFGIVGILLAITLVRRVFGLDPAREAERFDAARRAAQEPIETINIEVENPNLVGLTLRDVPALASLGVVVSRVLHDGTQQIAKPDYVLAKGDVLLAVGPRRKLDELRLIVGHEARVDLKQQPSDVKWERVVVTRTEALHTSIGQLNLRAAHNVTVSRVNRAGIELVPTSALKLQFGDILTIIGAPDAIAKAMALLGNKQSALGHAQLVPIFIGLVLGVILGSLPVSLPGMPAPLKLGLAGGVLVTAILLARLGNVGPVVWFMPPSVNLALREIGIVLFLATVGLRAGGQFVETLVEGDGLMWLLWGAVITFVPLFIVGLFARAVMKANYLTIGGLLAGSMTDPPALAFANALHPSEAPSLAYATVYPLVMVLRVIAPQLLVLLMW